MSFLAKAVQKHLKKAPPADEPVVQAEHTEKDLIALLIDGLGGWWPERSHQTVHASDLTKSTYCPRKVRLLDVLGQKVKDSYLPPALKATFDIGNVVGDLVRNDWLRSRAWGNWRCTRCNARKKLCKAPDPVLCSATYACGTKTTCNWTYEEVRFKDAARDYVGSIDLFLDLGGPALKLIELKIMAAGEFDEIKAPLSEHRVRTALYLHLIAQSAPLPAKLDTQEALILYVSRGYGKKHPEHGVIIPFKSFAVQRDDESIAAYLKKAEIIASSRQSGTIPTSGICETSFCKTANGCQVRAECFSGKYQ